MLNKYFTSQNFDNDISSYINKIIASNDFILIVKKNRKTKLGDFRIPNSQRKVPVITINKNLNQYHFLFTFLHELAHYYSFTSFGKVIKPHGAEWKKIFSELLIKSVEDLELPQDVSQVFVNHSKSPKYSSVSDVQLMRVLNNYNFENQKQTYLYELNNGDVFKLQNGRLFEKIVNKRSRIWCREINTNSIFAINQNAVVEFVK